MKVTEMLNMLSIVPPSSLIIYFRLDTSIVDEKYIMFLHNHNCSLYPLEKKQQDFSKEGQVAGTLQNEKNCTHP